MPPVEALKKVNDWLYRIERVIVVASLLVMSVVVFLSVVHRRYADPESVIADKVATKLFSAERDSETWQALQDVAGPITTLLLAAVIYLGFRTASRRPIWRRGDESGKSRDQIHGEPLSHLKCLLYTVTTVLVSWGVMVLLFGTGGISQSECIELRLAGDYDFRCGRFPAGLNWAQPLALILTLWVGFVGASMATKDNLHLKVEAVQQALPEKIKRFSGLLSGILTAGFCLLMAQLGWRYVMAKHEEWEIAKGLGGLHDGIAIPYFVSFAIVPLAWVIMGARFVGVGVLAFRGELEDTPAELRDLKKGEPVPEVQAKKAAMAEDDADAEDEAGEDEAGDDDSVEEAADDDSVEEADSELTEGDAAADEDEESASEDPPDEPPDESPDDEEDKEGGR